MIPLIDRFVAKIDISPSGCWLWTASVNDAGYGKLAVSGHRWMRAHRFSYEYFVGAIPIGIDVDHHYRCPKRCVNPDHLRLATRKQNIENHSGRPHRWNTPSGVRGVTWKADKGKWRASVKHRGRQYHGGYFATIEEANKAAVALRLKLFTRNDVDVDGWPGFAVNAAPATAPSVGCSR